MLTHLIITRFSVRTVLADKFRAVDANDAYLEYRMRLFRLFCLPSIQAQTNRNFKWFVLFGLETPDWLRIQLDEYEKAKAFTPLYADSFARAMDDIREWVRINIPCGESLITTRFDNDDALAANFVDDVQLACNPEQGDVAYFNPREGQQVVVRADDPGSWKYYHLRYPANPFVSMLERVTEEPVKTVYHRPHGSIKTQVVGAPVFTLTRYPMWMQILHGKNIGNGLWTRKAAEPSLTEFPFLKEYNAFGVPVDLKLPTEASQG